MRKEETPTLETISDAGLNMKQFESAADIINSSCPGNELCKDRECLECWQDWIEENKKHKNNEQKKENG
jgi:hypothetical protein